MSLQMALKRSDPQGDSCPLLYGGVYPGSPGYGPGPPNILKKPPAEGPAGGSEA